MSNLSPNLFGEFLEPEPSKPVGRPGRKSGNTGRRSGDIPMFESGTEIQKYITKSFDVDPFLDKGDINNMWKRKLKEAKTPQRAAVHGSGLYKAIKKDGFDWDFPVQVEHFFGENDKTMAEGHHRVAAAAEIERETGKPVWIPIKHYW